jgi:tetraacyldisaccharide 4'-kinase
MSLALERLWYGPRGLKERLLFVVLAPLSLLYGLGAWCFHALYDLGLRKPVRLAGVRVISVGNLVVGGAGKTPVTIWLARRALAAGLKVAVLSRGYGRSSTALVHFDARSLPPVSEAGDEPRLIARACPGVELWVGADRVESARAAVSAGAQLLILDDGFQHRRLFRDVNLLVDGGSGNGWPLPVGPLREFSSAKGRATVIWGRDGAEGTVRAQHVARRLRLPDGSEVEATSLAGRSVLVLTGIARPERLTRSLEALGARVLAVYAFADHHQFTEEELAPIQAEAKRQLAPIITTEKDLERLTIPVHVLIQDIELVSGSTLPAALDFTKTDAPLSPSPVEGAPGSVEP